MGTFTEPKYMLLSTPSSKNGKSYLWHPVTETADQHLATSVPQEHSAGSPYLVRDQSAHRF